MLHIYIYCWGIFNSSVKNLFNLESWAFPKLILVEKNFGMVVNFSENVSSSQSFFIVWNQTQINDFYLRRNRIEGSCLNLKGQAKSLLRTQKLYQITYIFCNLCDLFSFNRLIPTCWHQEEPLGCIVFTEPN